MQNLEILLYYVLYTLFRLLGYLDDQHGEFLEQWMAYHGFGEYCDLIKYCTTIGNGTKPKEEYTTIELYTL